MSRTFATHFLKPDYFFREEILAINVCFLNFPCWLFPILFYCFWIIFRGLRSGWRSRNSFCNNKLRIIIRVNFPLWFWKLEEPRTSWKTAFIVDKFILYNERQSSSLKSLEFLDKDEKMVFYHRNMDLHSHWFCAIKTQCTGNCHAVLKSRKYLAI